MDPHEAVSGKTAIERQAARDFLRPKKWTALFPNAELVEKDADQRLQLIIERLPLAIKEWELPAIKFYCDQLNDYVKRFHLRMPAATVTQLIGIVAEAIGENEEGRRVSDDLFGALSCLISKSRLNRDNVTVPWRPMYEQYWKTAYIKEFNAKKWPPVLMKLKKFYPADATKEIWDELLDRLSPLSHGVEFADLCVHFLPTDLTVEQHRKNGANLWFPMLWHIYSTAPMNAPCTDILPTLFYRLERDCPGAIDWAGKETVLFAAIVREFYAPKLKKINNPLIPLAGWVGFRIGSCEGSLRQLLRQIEPRMHPASAGSHTKPIFLFLLELAQSVMARYRLERIKEHTRDKRPAAHHMTDKHIRGFVSMVLPVMLPAIFTDSTANVASSILKVLATLAPEMVVPKVLEMVYPSLRSCHEPHRLRQSLECLEDTILILCSDKTGIKVEIPRLADAIGPTHDDPKDEEQMEPILPNPHDPSAVSMRCHVVQLLDELAAGIDVNDIDKTKTVIQILSHWFYLVSTIDASSLADDPSAKLTTEERALCRLTARMPGIAEKVVERIISIIEVMAAVPQRAEESVSTDSSIAAEGGDEKSFREAIDKCLNAVFMSSGRELRQSIATRILAFIRSNVIDASVAADMAQNLVQQAVFYVPEMADKFVALICKRLNRGLADMKKHGAAKADIALVWWSRLLPGCAVGAYAQMSDSLRATMLATVDLLVAETDSPLYESAVYTLNALIVMATHTREASQPKIQAMYDEPLKNWIPIRHWARLYKKKEVDLLWHVGNDAEIAFAQRLLDTYLGSALDRLQKPAALTNEAMRRDLDIVGLLYSAARPLLPPLQDAEDVQCREAEMKLLHLNQPYIGIPLHLPRSKLSNFELQLRGKPLREQYVACMEGLLDWILMNRADNARAQLQIASWLSQAIHPYVVFPTTVLEQTIVATDLLARVPCLIWQSHRTPLTLVLSYSEYQLTMYKYFQPAGPFTALHRRIVKMLVRCATGAYKEARKMAVLELKEITTRHPEAALQTVDLLLEAQKTAGNDEDWMKGALNLTRDLKLAALREAGHRIRVWNWLLHLKLPDRPGILSAFDDVWTTVYQMIPARLAKKPEDDDDAEEDGADKKKKKELGPIGKFRDEIRLAEERALLEFSKIVHPMCDSSEIHCKQRELARACLAKIHAHKPTGPVLQSFLNYTKDEQISMRKFAWYHVRDWLIKIKPKAVTTAWTGPPRDPKAPALACGLRADNLEQAYIVGKLPKSEEAWNQTLFFSSRHGGYKWPAKPIRGQAGAAGLKPSPKFADCDAVLLDFFKTPQNLQSLVSIWLLNSNAQKSAKKHHDVARAIKYIIRSYGQHEQLLHTFGAALQQLLTGKTKDQHRVGAELFFGIVAGSKHFPFERLQKLWFWLTPTFRTFIDRLNGEAEVDWVKTMKVVFKGEDVRRFWWLIEAMFAAIDRPMTPENSWHFGFKCDLLATSTWHNTELRQRAVDLAWTLLPNARLPAQRLGIVSLFAEAVRCQVDNMANDQTTGTAPAAGPRLDTLDQIVGRLYGKIADRLPSDRSTRSPGKQGDAMLRCGSLLSLIQDQPGDEAVICLRIMLDLLIVYYEEGIWGLTDGILKALPAILQLAYEEPDGQPMAQDSDIRRSAAILAYEAIAPGPIAERQAEPLLIRLEQLFACTGLWRVRQAIFKFIQVAIPQNPYAFHSSAVCVQKTRQLMISGLADPQPEVRTEAARCLMVLVHAAYLPVDEPFLNKCLQMTTSQQHGEGGLMALCALVQAFPFTSPPFLPKLVGQLCGLAARGSALTKKFATHALREFRRTHRECWGETQRTLGADLLYEVENVCAPNYYA